MNEQDYIGKKLSECPDGTVAVVNEGDGDIASVRALRNGIVVRVSPTPELRPNKPGPFPCDNYTVLHIIKLGEPRPKTLADCQVGEVWVKSEGTSDEIVYWRDWVNHACVSFKNRPDRTGRGVSDLSEIKITPDTRRLGQITGLMIDGKPWPAKDGDE